MRALPPGLATDIAVLEQLGASVVRRADHLLVRSPANPGFHWGNCVVVTDPAEVDDAARWDETFRVAFPTAAWAAVALIAPPKNPTAWERRGFAVALDQVLTARSLPAQPALPNGYESRQLVGEDWVQSTACAIAENERTQAEDPESFRRFAEDQTRARHALSERGAGAFFGAFAGDRLVASLGVVRCESTARYQAVVTDEEHRGRGLASHLLGLAAAWSAARGCDKWVIVTEATNPAGRVYRRAGFAPDVGSASAYRRPRRETARAT